MHLVLLFLFTCVNLGSALFPYVYPKIELTASLSGDAGTPLYLTPFLKNGSIDAAQKLSRVSLTTKLGFESHAGFFTVDEHYQSNLYFWYFPTFSKDPNAPVILWLQGGPGGSSLFGLFTEIGPLVATKKGFKLRKHHWALNSHLIFIDNPVGTGFSFTKNEEGYCTDENCVALGLYNAMQQFFTLFPKLRSHKFFITGESYAGKYIPALGMEIHNQNPTAVNKINLQGMAMGNAYCDPANQLDYGNYLYQHGLIDNNQLQVFEKLQAKIAAEIRKENWVQADLLMDVMMDGDVKNFSYFKNYTGFDNYYNFLKTSEVDITIFAKLLQDDKARESIHVGNLPFHSGKEVQLHLALDILKSVAPYVKTLLSHYRILIYNGQLDIIVAYPLTEKFLQNLDFSSAEEYKTAPRKIWRVGDEVAGYRKRAGNLTELLVRNAGHMVPHDQPKWAFDMITRFIQGKM
ncbi:venom serine carboxypeptidase-like [Cydia pomonella]|uniref:venom serine carboxypeptidase-like n=1 Tax=Cydia pomonella TaxID=82600 RepID=UPI002ADD4084|nr:venom serine carboxypeptidase-like [Cydia pomonella]